MGIFALSGNDTFVYNDRVLENLADGDCVAITYDNDTMAMKTGKNKNTAFAQNQTGSNVTCIIRVLKGSPDDKVLSADFAAQERDFVGSGLITAQGVKNLGDANGDVTQEIMNLQGGKFKKNVDVKQNVEGDTEQLVSIYTLGFAVGERSLG